eukprot:CAMPEP_0174382748 /NCGR_PEP_ID=MMETSP0811_2-20130205/124780_1 /TAXON_ID=73025 ORGANISM="Eutreptiella gymnastica-like, Strain CCMP1594" /NCGR_SAMPLE_ID=MMETSP0811_2 /ASSEMBLY_ACC=CAM_ASM_000667 /LENGTH=33 /DNA_ID= /DNA_START= /DNA_END= /DNA_ORIENTATION=
MEILEGADHCQPMPKAQQYKRGYGACCDSESEL